MLTLMSAAIYKVHRIAKGESMNWATAKAVGVYVVVIKTGSILTRDFSISGIGSSLA